MIGGNLHWKRGVPFSLSALRRAGVSARIKKSIHEYRAHFSVSIDYLQRIV